MATLDESNFKDLKTTRGFNYHYFAQSPASNSSLPTILFLHGYPNFSGDWHYQVAHFTKLGYGAIVPDLLGYGGTDKPTDPQSYGLKGMTSDVKEIVDAEGVDKVVVIGHDWGSIVTSRFVVYYPDRVIALGLLALGWTASLAGLDYRKSMAMLRAATGNDVIGYWEFMSADDADELLLQHLDSAFCLFFPENPDLWRENVTPLGALRKYLEEDKKNPLAPYVTAEEVQARKEMWKATGLKGAQCWYKSIMSGIMSAEDAALPAESFKTSKPVFLGTALRDATCIAQLQEMNTRQNCSDVTVIPINSSHWVPIEKPKEVNEALEKWLNEKVSM